MCSVVAGELVPIPTFPLESMRMRSSPAVASNNRKGEPTVDASLIKRHSLSVVFNITLEYPVPVAAVVSAVISEEPNVLDCTPTLPLNVAPPRRDQTRDINACGGGG